MCFKSLLKMKTKLKIATQFKQIMHWDALKKKAPVFFAQSIRQLKCMKNIHFHLICMKFVAFATSIMLLNILIYKYKQLIFVVKYIPFTVLIYYLYIKLKPQRSCKYSVTFLSNLFLLKLTYFSFVMQFSFLVKSMPT